MSAYAKEYLGVPTFRYCPSCRMEKRMFSFRRKGPLGKSVLYKKCNVCESKKKRNEKT